MPSASKPRSRAFTLVELLVVIAIIMILIAILLPVCIKIRTPALVLVCPIAYVGEDGAVYLTDPNEVDPFKSVQQITSR
jgi:prepilin-type N-terminal cleavage/methylation domain-containing protein